MRRMLVAAALAAAFVVGGPPPAAAQGTPDATWMTEDQVRTVLRIRGYAELGELRRDGDGFIATEAVRYGEPVGMLRIDPASGQVRDERPLSERQARALLQERGWAEVNQVRRDGEWLVALARRNGTESQLRVDPRTGTVRPQ